MTTTSKRLAAPLALACALSGCSAEPAPAPAAASSPAPTHYLGEWFAVGPAHCRIDRAERSLLEQRAGEGQVAEDVLMVDTRWTCRDQSEHGVDVAKLLPAEGPLAWVDDQHVTHLRSPRRGAPGHVYFAVPTQHDGLPRTRKYDAQTGDPEGTRELRRARITLAAASGEARVVVAPWPRLRDGALDGLVDRVVRTLATNAPFETLSATEAGREGMSAAATLYRQAMSTFAPQRVVVRQLELVEGQPRLALGFERSTAEHALAKQFTLALELDAARAEVLRLLDAEAARTDIACVEARRALSARNERKHDGPHCNVLQTLLSGRCDELPSDLLTHALRVGTRCGGYGSVGLDPEQALTPPSDFEVELVRGRALALDRSPRYRLTLMHDGVVHFQGEHQVSQLGRGFGRTSSRLLGALYARILTLGWFERPDPHRHCRKDEHGDVIRVRADGHERAVRDREGCRSGFEAHELAELRRAIERVGGADAWTAPSSELGRRDDQIWVVAAE